MCDASTKHKYHDSIELLELIATASWFIWWQRRQYVRGEQVQTPLRSALAIHALALNFTRAAGKQTTEPRWNTWPIILAAQQVLNLDASFFEDLHSGSCGAIVRDHRCNFIAASTSQLEHVADDVSAEAAALLEGLKSLQSMGCHNVFVRMDNSIMVHAIRLNEGHSMVVAPVLDDCCELLRESGKVTIEHCNRELNVVAHELAEWGHANGPFVWVDAPPIFVASRRCKHYLSLIKLADEAFS